MPSDFTDRVTLDGWECGCDPCRVARDAAGAAVCRDFECNYLACYSCRSHDCATCGRGYGEHATDAAVSGCPQPRDVAPRSELAPRTIVLVTLRWTEHEGRRTRDREQVRLGEVHQVAPDGHVAVAVPGMANAWYPPADVQDVGCGVRRAP
jgi:hypothetical protein